MQALVSAKRMKCFQAAPQMHLLETVRIRRMHFGDTLHICCSQHCSQAHSTSADREDLTPQTLLGAAILWLAGVAEPAWTCLSRYTSALSIGNSDCGPCRDGLILFP